MVTVITGHKAVGSIAQYNAEGIAMSCITPDLVVRNLGMLVRLWEEAMGPGARR